MAYRRGNRNQMELIPRNIDDYVSKDNPVRAYDAFVEALDLSKLGIHLHYSRVGNSEYDPKAMLKLLIYGYSYGFKSSRKLERECYHNISFIWLMGGLRPDYKTIAEFRRKNKPALEKVLHQCVRLCMKLDLVAGNILFVDGTKIRANASRDKSHNEASFEKQLVAVDERIAQLMKDCEAVDMEEEGSASFVAMNKELTDSETLKDRIEAALSTLKDSDKKQVNLTDPDCAIMRSVQGSHASYNVQHVVDDKHGLIVHADATNETSDVGQFAKQIEAAQENTGKTCDVACADAGYASTTELEKVDQNETTVIVPSQRQALHEEEGPFSKSHFAYDAEQDRYRCPEGHVLACAGTDSENGRKQYRIEDRSRCQQCRHYGQCTKAKMGRRISRLPNEEARKRFEALYQQASSQEIYARRKMKVELPFGHIKRNLKTDAFSMRGLEGARAESSILATCFNLSRMITLIGGVIPLLARLMA